MESYQVRMSLAPVAFRPAGLCPMRTVTGVSAAAASRVEKRSRSSASPLMGVA
jgi:hypothetical protein